MKKFHLMFFVTIICLLTIWSYRLLLYSFFEQDEWVVFAETYLFSTLSFVDQLKKIFYIPGMLGHFIPFSTVYSFVIFTLFRLEFSYYAIHSIFIHAATVVCFFFIIKKLFNNIFIAAFSSLLFGIHRLSSQVVTWISASVGAELSTFFFLLSVLLYLFFIENNKKKLLVFANISFLISILYKETTVTLLAVYPLLFYVQKKKIQFIDVFIKYIHNWIYFPLSIVILFIIKYVLIQINPLKLHSVGDTGVVQPLIIFIKIILYPLLALAQIYDTSGIIYNFSSIYLKNEFKILNENAIAPIINATLVPDILYLLSSIIILGIFLFTGFLMFKLKKNREGKLFFIFLIMFFISIIPYVPLPRFNSFLEQRYYYTPNIFAAVLLTVVAYFYIDILKFFKYRHIFSIAIIGIILFHNYFTLQEDLRNKVALASVRKNILFQFKKELPVLPAKKNVFYVTGNGKDYLMEGAGLKVPFQSGFGNVLMIWYFDKNKITPGLLDDAFLYQLADQGYKQIGQSGFGYYFQRKKLLNDLHKKKFSVDNVLSFYWDVSSKKLLQTTISERKELMKEIQK